ncbi:hypothetical protein [Ligilactobacillus salivarius]|uniref:hypothetical protein n=1 Tax=Ligilactobacillus salivarius TaxID=1624 RepID=UPI003F8CBDB2
MSLTPISFNLGSELRLSALNCSSGLTPMSFNLGSELLEPMTKLEISLTPMPFNLGSEPLFSNLYLIVTQVSWELFRLAMSYR